MLLPNFAFDVIYTMHANKNDTQVYYWVDVTTKAPLADMLPIVLTLFLFIEMTGNLAFLQIKKNS